MARRGSIQISYDTLWAIGALIIISLMFFHFPQIDLWVAHALYRNKGIFALNNNDLADFFHYQIDVLIKFGFVIGLIAYVAFCSFWFKNLSKENHKKFVFVFSTVAIAELFIINVALKEYWGRARPSQLIQFNGKADFTRAWQMARQCVENCSFVSGHVGLAACLGLLAVFLPSKLRLPYLVLVAIFTAMAAVMRMGRGAHFLSDVVISPLIILVTAMVLKDILKLKLS